MKIATFDLYVYLVFFSLYKAYFIPSAVRQIIKIITLILVFLYLTNKLEKKDTFNCALLFSATVVASGVYNYALSRYTTKALLDSFLYALTFYDLYILFLYANRRGYAKRMITDLYRINLVYCMVTAISVLFIGVENNSNVAAYPFGNKFTSSYLFISLIALYGASHNMNTTKSRRVYGILVMAGCTFALYVDCATATVSLIAAVVLFEIERKVNGTLIQGSIVTVGALIGTAITPYMMTMIVKNKIVNYIIYDLFHRSYTVGGRLEIYSTYLYKLVRNRFWFGYGYSSGVMHSVTNVFANAQNGLMDQMLNFGMLGVVAILITVAYALRNKAELSYMIILLYAMIIAAIFEVTIDWFFWTALFSVQHLSDKYDCATPEITYIKCLDT